jgi:hypothetical protein
LSCSVSSAFNHATCSARAVSAWLFGEGEEEVAVTLPDRFPGTRLQSRSRAYWRTVSSSR